MYYTLDVITGAAGMTMTVKKLIIELEKIENKFLEVKISSHQLKGFIEDIRSVKISENNRKVLIFLDNE